MRSAESEECQTAVPDHISAKEYLSGPRPTLASDLPACRNNPARFCHSGSVPFVSADGAFAVVELSAGRDAFPIGYTWTYHSYLVFSCRNCSDVGEVKVSPRVYVRAVLASKNNRDYLITVESGFQLVVYQLNA